MGDVDELFELCKQMYEATGWTSSDLEQTAYAYPDSIVNNIDYIPLYTSDYLLEKLLPRTNIEFILQSDGKTLLTYGTESFVDKYIFADTPLKALLKLTLALHEAELLTPNIGRTGA